MQTHPLSNISIAPLDSTSNRTPDMNMVDFQINSEALPLHPVQSILNIEQNTVTNNIENNIQESRYIYIKAIFIYLLFYCIFI